MRASGKQFMLIAGAALLTAVLYFSPKKTKKEAAPVNAAVNFENVLKDAKAGLKSQEAGMIEGVESALIKDPESVPLTDSLARAWDKLNKPYVSAHYFEKIAEKNPGERNWINAAYRYFDAFRMAEDSAIRKYFVDKAIASYSKVLEINPGNLDARTDLGVCYAEGSSNPMQGIMMLREVVEKNPGHEMAQYNLGILSVKSQQYEKALERFNKVLEINPANTDARFLLGRTYLLMGKKDLALKNLEMIRTTNNPELNKEVNNLINQINNN